MHKTANTLMTQMDLYVMVAFKKKSFLVGYYKAFKMKGQTATIYCHLKDFSGHNNVKVTSA